MKLQKIRAAYDYYSATVSTVARQLGFAGIAIIWIFKTDQGGAYTVPPELVWPGLLLVGGLAADFLHYVAGVIMWGSYGRYMELKGVDNDQEFFAPSWMNWPGNTFFVSKLVLIALAYALLVIFLIGKVIAAA